MPKKTITPDKEKKDIKPPVGDTRKKNTKSKKTSEEETTPPPPTPTPIPTQPPQPPTETVVKKRGRRPKPKTEEELTAAVVTTNIKKKGKNPKESYGLNDDYEEEDPFFNTTEVEKECIETPIMRLNVTANDIKKIKDPNFNISEGDNDLNIPSAFNTNDGFTYVQNGNPTSSVTQETITDDDLQKFRNTREKELENVNVDNNNESKLLNQYCSSAINATNYNISSCDLLKKSLGKIYWTYEDKSATGFYSVGSINLFKNSKENFLPSEFTQYETILHEYGHHLLYNVDHPNFNDKNQTFKYHTRENSDYFSGSLSYTTEDLTKVSLSSFIN
jgi:hypothetical protein